MAVLVGDIFEAEVRDLTSAGQGVVSHPSGATVFAAGVWLGERGKFRVHSKKGRVGFADLIELLHTAESRRVSPCQYQGHSANHCGACPWMIVDYEAQLAAKQARVVSYVGRLSPSVQINTIWPAADEFGWRNRVQLKSDGKKLGYIAANSHELIDVAKCPVLSEKNATALEDLRAQLPNKAWRPVSNRQPWSTLDIDESTGAEAVSVNKRLPFQQANSAQNLAMRAWLLNKLVSFGPLNSVLELFCGSGNFTEVIAAAGVPAIHALEGAQAAIYQLAAKNIPGVKAEVCDLFDETLFLSLMAEHKQTDVLVLDPPRDGLKQKAGLFPKKAKFKHVLYISCDLATFCRDAEAFIRGGYDLIQLQPADQFPHTPHIELLAHFQRRK